MSIIDDPRAIASLLVMEIGNSHVSVATAIDRRIYSNQRFGHDQIDEIVRSAADAWAALPDDRGRAIAAGGVVPSVLQSLRGRVSDELDHPISVVGEELHRPLSLAVETPANVGTDRVCSAAAAYDTLRHACVIASFGTAITVDCVSEEGAFLGGSILPGLDMQCRSLHEGAAQLPRVSLSSPPNVFGSNTEEAIAGGVLFGAIGAVREITERYATELGHWPELIATGGNAVLIDEHCDFIDRVVPDLCIRGIALAYRKHFMPFEEDK